MAPVLIGQPRIADWFITVQIVCSCEDHTPFLVVGKVGSVGICPTCRKLYKLDGVSYNPVTQLIDIPVSHRDAPRDLPTGLVPGNGLWSGSPC